MTESPTAVTPPVGCTATGALVGGGLAGTAVVGTATGGTRGAGAVVVALTVVDGAGGMVTVAVGARVVGLSRT
jgi:hypothetical protein